MREYKHLTKLGITIVAGIFSGLLLFALGYNTFGVLITSDFVDFGLSVTIIILLASFVLCIAAWLDLITRSTTKE